MSKPVNFNAAHTFAGIVWNTIAADSGDVLVVEVRNPAEKQVLFSALDFGRNLFLWKDRKLEEPWWINASAVAHGVVLFTVYMDTNNPDTKGIIAFNLEKLDLLWWNNDFSISQIAGTAVSGFSSKLGLKQVFIDIATGKETSPAAGEPAKPNSALRKPVQYAEGMEYFETVKTFLKNALNLNAVSALEYLETDKLIIISLYAEENGLVNYLVVVSTAGEELLREKLDAPVKGIGLDTFFVLNDLLFFVRNKVDLVSYRLL